MTTFKQLGAGLAVAILLDATVVRAVLLPSVLCVLGDRTWWLPAWLSFLPDRSNPEQAPTKQPPPSPTPISVGVGVGAGPE
jgi:RND superfamily putative drug exporter